jgi:hypothetical protein
MQTEPSAAASGLQELTTGFCLGREFGFQFQLPGLSLLPELLDGEERFDHRVKIKVGQIKLRLRLLPV